MLEFYIRLLTKPQIEWTLLDGLAFGATLLVLLLLIAIAHVAWDNYRNAR